MLTSHRLGIALLVAATGLPAACTSSRPATPDMISGRYIAALGDADMSASGFASNDLGERDPTAKDTLTILSLPIQEPDTPYGQIEISNSALGPAAALAVSSDGRYAFVAEYKGHAPDGATRVDQLPLGRSLASVDLSDPMQPRLIESIYVGTEPAAVAAHPDGSLVAVVTGQARQQIVMIAFQDGHFTGEPVAWPLLGLDNDESRASSICWHPSGRALAVTLQDRGEVVFYRFRREADGGLALSPWGEPVDVGRSPYVAAFTPNGRHLLVNDFRHGMGDEPGVGEPQGRVSIVRVGDMSTAMESPEEAAGDENAAATDTTGGHVMVGSTEVGVRPVGLAISNDGLLAATSNLRTSAFPDGDPRLNGEQPRGGSVSLLSVGEDGDLRTLGEYPINAVPAGLAFDAADKFVAVTQFRSFDPAAIDGEIAFFQIRGRGENTTLEQCDFYLGAGKGPHGVLIIK